MRCPRIWWLRDVVEEVFQTEGWSGRVSEGRRGEAGSPIWSWQLLGPAGLECWDPSVPPSLRGGVAPGGKCTETQRNSIL